MTAKGFRIKRIYDPPEAEDGVRVLVDRLWPRGLAKDRAGIDCWAKEIAPSTALRKDFDHNHDRWEEFLARYRLELTAPEAAATLDKLRAVAKTKAVTLLFAAKDTERNNAVALRAFLEEKPALKD